MPMYVGFYHPTTVSISQALNFVERKIVEFFEARKLSVDVVHHPLIDEERKKQVQVLDKARENLKRTDDLAMISLSEQTYKDYMDVLRSALEAYLHDMLDAKAKTNLSIFDETIAEITRTINLEAFKTRKTELFDQYYQVPAVSPEGERIEIFMSYANENKVLAGNIATQLKEKGIDVFLAHEDIEVSEEWRKEILKHLNRDGFLIALLTPEYEKSVWTHQEAGYMLGKGGKTIPLIVGNAEIKKFGFLESFQGIPVEETNVVDCVEKIVEASLKQR